MVSLKSMEMSPSQLCSKISFPTPKPMVLYSDNSVTKWVERFKILLDESDDNIEKHDYDQCYSALKWAHFCNVTNLSLRVGKHFGTYTIEIKFFFDDYNHLRLFFNELYKVLEGTMRY